MFVCTCNCAVRSTLVSGSLPRPHGSPYLNTEVCKRTALDIKSHPLVVYPPGVPELPFRRPRSKP
eukprot:526581-Pelagomonas_calceolata.AAC.2